MWLQEMAGKFGKSFYFDKYYFPMSRQTRREALEFLGELILPCKKAEKKIWSANFHSGKALKIYS